MKLAFLSRNHLFCLLNEEDLDIREGEKGKAKTAPPSACGHILHTAVNLRQWKPSLPGAQNLNQGPSGTVAESWEFRAITDSQAWRAMPSIPKIRYTI